MWPLSVTGRGVPWMQLRAVAESLHKPYILLRGLRVIMLGFDALSMLAYAASEATKEDAEAARPDWTDGAATGPPSSSSNADSASTMTFSSSPNLTASVRSGAYYSVEDISELPQAAESTPPSPGGGVNHTEYECGYCGERKVSTSTGGDGRVRIRCECGGKHGDRKARMHAKWTLCSDVEEPTHGKATKSRRHSSWRPWLEDDAQTR